MQCDVIFGVCLLEISGYGGRQATDTTPIIPVADLSQHVELLTLLGSAQSTIRVYERAWDKFSQFLAMYGWQSSQPNVHHVLLFVAYLSKLGHPSSTIYSYVSGIKYRTRLAGLQIHQSFILSKVLKGCKKDFSTTDVRIPISIDLLTQLCQCLWAVTNSQYEATMFAAMFTLAFFGLCRVGEITYTGKSADHTICSQNVFKTHAGYVLALMSSKNNQSGPPQYINLAPNSIICPVSALGSYLSIRPYIAGKLFVHSDGSMVTDSNFRGVLSKALQFLQIPCQNVKSHSFRIGGATYMYSLGFSDDQIRKAGRWSLNSVCFKCYIRH